MAIKKKFDNSKKDLKPVLSWRVAKQCNPEIWRALLLHKCLGDSVQKLNVWLERGNPKNIDQLGLANQIGEILKARSQGHLKTSGRKLLPEVGQLLENLKYEIKGANEQIFKYKKPIEDYRIYLRRIEYNGQNLVDQIQSPLFLNEFDDLPILKKLEVQANVLKGLAMSRAGLIYLKTNTLQGKSNGSLPLCNLNRLNFVQEEKYKNRPKADPLPKEIQSVLEILTATLPGLTLSGLLENDEPWVIEKFLPLMEGVFPSKHFDPQLDYSEIVSNDNMVYYVDKVQGNFGKVLKEILGYNPLDLLTVTLKLYKVKQDPSVKNRADVAKSILTLTERLAKSSTNPVLRDYGVGISRTFGRIFGVISATVEGLKAWEAYEKEDLDLALGFSLSTIASIGFLFTLGPFATVIFAGIGLSGAFWIWNDETDIEEWLKNCYFGQAWPIVWKSPPEDLNPKQFQYLWRTQASLWDNGNHSKVINLSRQIANFYSIQFPIKTLKVSLNLLTKNFSVELDSPFQNFAHQITFRLIDKQGIPRQTFNLLLGQEEQKRFLPMRPWPKWLKQIWIETDKGRDTYFPSRGGTILDPFWVEDKHPSRHVAHEGDRLAYWGCEIVGGLDAKNNSGWDPLPKFLEVDLLPGDPIIDNMEEVYIWEKQYEREEQKQGVFSDSDQYPFLSRKVVNLLV